MKVLYAFSHNVVHTQLNCISEQITFNAIFTIVLLQLLLRVYIKINKYDFFKEMKKQNVKQKKKLNVKVAEEQPLNWLWGEGATKHLDIISS